MKNILIFMPAIAAHTPMTGSVSEDLLLAFFSFSLCASFVYVLNDLLDLESDRCHPRKCFRPFASGQVPIWIGAVIAPVLILSSVLLALDVEWFFMLAFNIFGANLNLFLGIKASRDCRCFDVSYFIYP